MEGEGSSHGWIEIYDKGFWYPIDPTNNCVVTDSYIKISQGRSAADCAINRGIITYIILYGRTFYTTCENDEDRLLW